MLYKPPAKSNNQPRPKAVQTLGAIDPYGTEGLINDTIFRATTFDAEKDNPYELLGFKSLTLLNARELTDGEVHAAFRQVSRTLHPDMTGVAVGARRT